MRYTTRGPESGSCGHLHQTREAAERCILRSMRARGRHTEDTPSDRMVVPVPSSWDRLFPGGFDAQRFIDDMRPA